MIPFENTLPYETIGKDVYLIECPYCGERNVLLPLRTADLTPIREGRKRLIVFPCCREKMTAVDADRDYLLGDRPIRRR
ncbi:MAG: hypothetical protein K0R28_4250 [Paenibacillus sp.]|jgi:hypothetical protein|uniref:hypothetical protein n=1 Tax=Paenibacillus mesophilus TaxID=2582849 RepID=UPI00110E831C|nr:hypothetical protein [Paenibacillus mesophilus]MDF2717325.1 hypothetical protein [Paenibacillus sp.]TMV46462.1 hypothetical protein FE783_26235 [Paenibacillus mesophilus]